MIRRANLIVALIAALGTLATAADVEAQRRGQRGRSIDGVRFDAHLDVGWWGAFGAGFRVDIPIVPDGFIDRMHDELAISFGGEVFFWTWYNERDYWGRGHGYYDYHHEGVAFAPVAAAQWNFYLNESWSLFPELGIATFIFWHRHEQDRPTHGHFRVSPLASFGARWHFSDRNALLFRATWPVGFQVGITF